MKQAETQVHDFLMTAPYKGDFHSSMASLIGISDLQTSEDFAEKMENLNKAFHTLSGNDLLEMDQNLNFKLDQRFTKRYRAMAEHIKGLKNPDAFEEICALLLSHLGCEYYKATQRSHDQGLDFIGWSEKRPQDMLSQLTGTYFFVGQAKLYNSPVSSMEIREFFGSVALLKKGIFAAKSNYAYSFAKNLRHFTNLQPLFVTSSEFSTAAIKLCEDLDIAMFDITRLCLWFLTKDDLFLQDNSLNYQTLKNQCKTIRDLG